MIITPTAELASQVADVARSLGKELDFRTSLMTSLNDTNSDQKALRLGTDILVSTPGRLHNLIRKGSINLDFTNAVILDEADVLMEDISFPLKEIGDKVASFAQFIFTTATMPPNVERQINNEFPNIISLRGPGLHKISPTTQLKVVDCSQSESDLQKKTFDSDLFFDNKCSALLNILRNSNLRRTLVFCNSILQCRDVENMLNRKSNLISFPTRKIKVLPYHGAIDVEQRNQNMIYFCR